MVMRERAQRENFELRVHSFVFFTLKMLLSSPKYFHQFCRDVSNMEFFGTRQIFLVPGSFPRVLFGTRCLSGRSKRVPFGTQTGTKKNTAVNSLQLP